MPILHDPARVDGFAPIRDYALIGDGRTTALVAKDGAIDWLCLPNADSPSVLSAVLDARQGGSFVVRPAVPFDVSRRYLPATNLLETTFTTAAGAVRVLDAMTLPDDRLGPMRELTRAVDGISGDVPMVWRLSPRFHYAADPPVTGWRLGVPVATCGSKALAVRSWDAGVPAWEGEELRGEFRSREGSRALIVLASAYAEPLVIPGRTAVEDRIERTKRFWETWAADRTYDGPWRDPVVRSALVLKLLIFSPSGATTAAPTTSLPEEIGGVRNWDYRYCWIRDANFLIDALLRVGAWHEAQALFWWFMQATARTEPKLQVLYRLDGGMEVSERELAWLSGYRGSRPVRVGNGAVSQLQLDPYGVLLDTAWLYSRGGYGYGIDPDTLAVFARIADLVCDLWRLPDAGIWEVRGEPQHFTHSKVMCWVALDRAMRLAERYGMRRAHVARWRREAAAIRAYVETSCWSDRLGSYTRSTGSDDVDASLLMLPIVEYGDPAGPRMNGTIDAICRELRRGPFVYRYKYDDGLPGTEGAFLNCSFWLVSALARAGRHDEAAALMNDLIARANDVGLYAEELDPATGDFLGNFPQALVHLSLIDAAVTIAGAAAGSTRRS